MPDMSLQQAWQILGIDASHSPQQIDGIYEERRSSLLNEIAQSDGSSTAYSLLQNALQEIEAAYLVVSQPGQEATLIQPLHPTQNIIPEDFDEDETLFESDQTIYSTPPHLENTRVDPRSPSFEISQLISQNTAGRFDKINALLGERYDVTELIGHGGMGVIYKAYDQVLDAVVAIKQLLPSFTRDNVAKKLFLSEARLSCQLSHPNIINVYDVKKVDEEFFITMEFLEGKDLKQLMQSQLGSQKQFPLVEVQKMVAQLGSALDHAHKIVVHRDIKPANIWQLPSGQYKLMDFGIARGLTSDQRTQIDGVLGTPNYMAPEQQQSELEIDGRADQYALAVVTYEMLSGQRPVGIFEPIRNVRKDIPKHIEQVISRALSAKPENRYPNIKTFADAFCRKESSTFGKKTAITLGLALPIFGATGLAYQFPEKVPAQLQPLLKNIPFLQTQQANTNNTTQTASATQKVVKAPKLELVTIPKGAIASEEDGLSDINSSADWAEEQTIIESFKLMAHEVTKAQFAKFIEATNYQTDADTNAAGLDGCLAYIDGSEFDWASGSNWDNPGFEQADNEPVVCVSYNDVQAFINWLNELTGKSYRLPTAQEWEYAALAQSHSDYFFGDDTSNICMYANTADTSFGQVITEYPFFTCNDAAVFTAPVGSFSANKWNVYDMHGNVWEWVEDCVEGGTTDCAKRVLKGGGWTDMPELLTATHKDGDIPTSRFSNTGFRLALDLQ